MPSLESRIEALAETFAALDLVAFALLLLTLAETLWDFSTKRRRGWRETAANFAIALGNTLLERTAFDLVFLVALALAETFAPWRLPQTWWSWPLTLLAVDFTYYWMHRAEHEVRLLWAYHSVHHSSSEFNLTTALRLAWVEGLVEWLFFLPMILLGFDLVQTLVALLINLAYQTAIHSEKIGRLGWAEGLFNTPSVHRVHHAINSRYLDKNYGGILIVWDRLFGSYQVEEEKVRYGVWPQIGTANPLRINFHESARIARDVWRARGLVEALGYIFAKPGWTPAGAVGPGPHRRS